ncbi:MAG TPA: hypothetical protein DCX14_12565 [Flavobacteriales bacterium]|nr:FAD-dependent monooxygenase [Flavobacteriales bacterium]HAW21007.1 hypothetical protein [Flavobacteriales bacterium]
MQISKEYDIAIIGGGIAGLSMAIQCAKSGLKTVLFEKDSYPRHKVCGEYISNESLQFLSDLGIQLEGLNLPKISKFRLTNYFNHSSHCTLKPGGFGWSRYQFDEALYNRAQQVGVEVKTSTRITETQGSFIDGYKCKTNEGEFVHARMMISAAGRAEAMKNQRTKEKSEPWVGVKYHLLDGPPSDTIEIHAFRSGYAGISQIEDGKFCMAYLCKASGLKAFGGNIERYENEVLSQNKHLAERLKGRRVMGPITTSQFYFGVVDGDFSAIGDAAGFIPPLTGNGMSLALRSSKFSFHQVQKLFSNEIDETQFQKEMSLYVKGYLKKRVNRGIVLQNLLFLKPETLNRAMMKVFSWSPFALRTMTKLAVGETI